MPRVVHFEIHADEPERAIRFYSNLFGWQFKSWGGPMDYWLIKTGPYESQGIDGGLVRRRGAGEGQSVTAYICTIDVPALDQYMDKIQPLGGQIALPKMPVPGVGWLGYGKDPESNIFGMMQADVAAK